MQCYLATRVIRNFKEECLVAPSSRCLSVVTQATRIKGAPTWTAPTRAKAKQGSRKRPRRQKPITEVAVCRTKVSAPQCETLCSPNGRLVFGCRWDIA
jgi:hypothetical protein